MIGKETVEPRVIFKAREGVIRTTGECSFERRTNPGARASGEGVTVHNALLPT